MSNPRVCGPLDSGKIDTDGDPPSVTVNAPDGFLIVGYCVKAGTDVVYSDVAPTAVLVITHPNGKDVSHYSYSLVQAPPPETTVPEVPETTVPEVPEVPVPTVVEVPEVPETTTLVPTVGVPPVQPPEVQTLPATGSEVGLLLAGSILLASGLGAMKLARR